MLAATGGKAVWQYEEASLDTGAQKGARRLPLRCCPGFCEALVLFIDIFALVEDPVPWTASLCFAQVRVAV